MAVCLSDEEHTMAKIYETISGDTWDVIAKKVYGNELHTSFLMANNQEHLGCFVFPDGIILKIEDMPEKKGTLPDWRL